MPTTPPASPAAPSLKDSRIDFIKQHIPDWLLNADASARANFRRLYIRHLEHQHAVANRLALLKTPTAFAQPILELALLARFDSPLDVTHNFIKITHVHSHLFGLFTTTAAATHQTLLQAALQNFEASETEPDGFIEGSMLYARLGQDGWHSLRPRPEQFAQVCRTLDLGSQYQQHIRSVFSAPALADDWRHESQTPIDFIAHGKSTLEVMACIAALKGDISQSAHTLLTKLVAGESTLLLQGESVFLSSITFLGTVLTGPVLICAHITDKARRQPCIGYIPVPGEASLKEYVSIAHFEAHLSELLRADRTAFLLHFVPLRQQQTFKESLASYYPDDTSLELIPCNESLFEHLHQQRLERMLDDARQIAVPVEDVNMEVRNRRIQTLESAGWTLATLALSLIPGVGEAMLALTSAHVLYQAYHGVEAWSENDLNLAAEYLLDITDSLAEMAVIGAGTHMITSQLRTIKMPEFVARLAPVTLPDGTRRLWNVDLTPYQQDLELPVTALPNKQGLYAFHSKDYLKLDQQVFEVTRDTPQTPWRVKHPTDNTAFSPTLTTNHYGAWRLEQEQPLFWDNAKLIKRLGRYGETLEQDDVDFIMSATGVSTEMLQRVHADNLVPPGLLIDALKRLAIDRKIKSFIEDIQLNQTPDASNAELWLQLLTSLPGWPGNKPVRWIDDLGQVIRDFGDTVPNHTRLPVTNAQLQAGIALDTLLAYLDHQELTTLLGHPPSVSPQTNTAALGEAMSAYAQIFRHRVFEILYQHSEVSDNELTQAIRRSYPTMPTSVADELIVTTRPSEQLQLLGPRPLPPVFKTEADALMARLSVNRVYEGLYLDSVSSEQSDLLAFSIFEHLVDWPTAQNIELHQHTAEGPLLASTYARGDSAKRILITSANRYQALSPEGQPVSPPGSIYYALYNCLSESERQLLGLSTFAPVQELKQLMAQTRLQADKQSLARRNLPKERRELSELFFPSFQQLDLNFASQESLEGIPPRTDGIYQGIYQKFPENGGLVRNFIKVHAWTFQVELTRLGWRLIDARNPFRCYKPLIRRTADDSWELDQDSGLKGGSPGIGSSRVNVEESSTDPFFTASERPWTEYTPRESAIMRNTDNYQHARNQPGTYERAENGRYPLRDLHGNPLRIRSIQTRARSTSSSTRYHSELIRPYIEWEGYEAVGSLYEEKLHLRPFTEADIQVEGEQLLVGQSMVTAKIRLNKGEVLGVYSGELIPYHIAHRRRDPYVIDVMTKRSSTHNPRFMPVVLSGTNILSRINTTFEYVNGKPVRQAASGYNVEIAPFVVDTLNTEGVKEKYLLTGMFASEIIEADTELRWNYAYNERDIQHLFS